jgi:tRNA modification GTPase
MSQLDLATEVVQRRSTIFALASGVLPCAIAILRISGPRAGDVPRLLGTRAVVARRASVRHLTDPTDGSLIDEALLVFFPSPSSATGEDVLEIQCHGSRAVVARLEQTLGKFDGFEKAGPGDFTRRAFSNGRLALAGVEALGDLLSAETDRQRRAALALWEGGLTHDVGQWRDAALGLAAQIEMALDFAEEGDEGHVETLLIAVRNGIVALHTEIAERLARPSGERLREGLRVVLAGPPNAGKSTLFNALVGRDAAIVAPEAGTTRDVIESSLSWHGLPFLLCDTAGLRDESESEVESVGIRRAATLAEQADIVLWLGAPDAVPAAITDPVLVRSKADLSGDSSNGEGIAVSARTGQGLSALIDAIVRKAEGMVPMAGDYGLNRRQRAWLEVAAEALLGAQKERDELLIADWLRSVLGAFEALIGRADTEAMLDTLFARFCIGK